MLSSIIFVLALSLPFSVAAAPPRRDESLHIPLIRRRSNVQRDFVDVDHYAGVASNMRAKYNFAPSSPSRRAQTTDVGITNQVRFSSATFQGSNSHYSTQQGPRYELLRPRHRRHSVSAKPFPLPSHLLCFSQTPEIQSRP